MNSRPSAEPHRSTGTYTSVAGRKAFGRVKATWSVPLVDMAPLNWTIPETDRTAG